jgi:gluconate 2-dehydrogenase gamma chain
MALLVTVFVDTHDPSRRQFLIGSGSGIGAVWIGLQWPAILAAQEHAHRAAEQRMRFEFFTPEQVREIEAVTAQLIPSDDGPGAREAHAVYFIDRALVSFERDKQVSYTRGLEYLRAKTRELFPQVEEFSALGSEDQVRLLRSIENTNFFELVRVHTIMGFLSNPEYGGNSNQLGWKMIGFEESHVHEPPFGYYDAGYENPNRDADTKETKAW